METKTLYDAIRSEIDSLVTAGESFSAYTVTKKVRDKVNILDLNISDVTETDYFNGCYVQKISHYIVKEIVHSIMATITSYKKEFANGFYQYSLQTQTVVDNSVTVPIVAPTAVVAGDPTSPLVIQQATSYFNARYLDDNPATLKSTQSRFKRSPMTIDQIKDMAEKAGYQIRPKKGFAYCYSHIIPAIRTAIGNKSRCCMSSSSN